MWAFWVFLALLVLFFVWAGRKTRRRTGTTQATGDRHRRTRGHGLVG